MFYNGVFRCHGNTCYVILIGLFYMIPSIGPMNVCTYLAINRYWNRHAKFHTNSSRIKMGDTAVIKV